MPRSELSTGGKGIFQRPSHPFRASDGADLKQKPTATHSQGLTQRFFCRVAKMTRHAIGALLVSVAAAENSVFQISIPASLRKPGGYSHAASLFGRPSYASTTQRLYYAGDGGGDGTLCTFDTTKTYPTPFILMVDRGDCTFVTKARNAQQMGATALVLSLIHISEPTRPY